MDECKECGTELGDGIVLCLDCHEEVFGYRKRRGLPIEIELTEKELEVARENAGEDAEPWERREWALEMFELQFQYTHEGKIVEDFARVE